VAYWLSMPRPSAWEIAPAGRKYKRVKWIPYIHRLTTDQDPFKILLYGILDLILHRRTSSTTGAHIKPKISLGRILSHGQKSLARAKTGSPVSLVAWMSSIKNFLGLYPCHRAFLGLYLMRFSYMIPGRL